MKKCFALQLVKGTDLDIQGNSENWYLVNDIGIKWYWCLMILVSNDIGL